jgi:hypothetical protein
LIELLIFLLKLIFEFFLLVDGRQLLLPADAIFLRFPDYICSFGILILFPYLGVDFACQLLSVNLILVCQFLSVNLIPAFESFGLLPLELYDFSY